MIEGETPKLTLNEESDVGYPYAQRNRYNNPVFVPNGYARVMVHESGFGRPGYIEYDDDIHTKHD